MDEKSLVELIQYLLVNFGTEALRKWRPEGNCVGKRGEWKIRTLRGDSWCMLIQTRESNGFPVHLLDRRRTR